eukprot:NODE_1829_length_540_cov_416.847251_g1484_i0.p1 GENE.NODE_1829_length_540_cov_416.847251_g1484_i0~~NODE_1829_length_540_cov_416.847251_g1484_i0.p1  ORF type:complete len:140 (-),score=27.73 NODE_1829_length_540_cov_416.847251_g1484_i0:119-511(-)
MGPGGIKSRLPFVSALGFPHDVARRDGRPGRSMQCNAMPPQVDCQRKLDYPKSKMIGNLQKTYGVSSKQTVLFDDQSKHFAPLKRELPGITTQLASTNCGGKWCPEATGLTKDEFEQGFAAVQRKAGYSS